MDTNEWQPIETAPKNGSMIFLRHKDGNAYLGYFCADIFSTHPKPYWNFICSPVSGPKLINLNHPTHWMPLPKFEEKS